MNDHEKEIFEKGRQYEHLLDEQVAEQKYESVIICLLTRIFGEKEGTVAISDLELTLAKSRWVTFTRNNPAELSVEIKLVKEIS